jgi:hypothetical protein
LTQLTIALGYSRTGEVQIRDEVILPWVVLLGALILKEEQLEFY